MNEKIARLLLENILETKIGYNLGKVILNLFLYYALIVALIVQIEDMTNDQDKNTGIP